MAENRTLKQRIEDDIRTAMKANDKLRLGALRMVKAKMMEAEVALRGKKGRDYQLEDAEAIQCLSTSAKQRKDSIEAFRQGGREDLAKTEEAELAVIQQYLPQQMSAQDIARIAREAIASVGATSQKDMGAVMKIVMPQVKGAADGKEVNRIISELLAPKS